MRISVTESNNPKILIGYSILSAKTIEYTLLYIWLNIDNIHKNVVFHISWITALEKLYVPGYFIAVP